MKMIYLGSKCKVFVLLFTKAGIKLVVGISEDKRLAKTFQF